MAEDPYVTKNKGEHYAFVPTRKRVLDISFNPNLTNLTYYGTVNLLENQEA